MEKKNKGDEENDMKGVGMKEYMKMVQNKTTKSNIEANF